MGALPGIKSTMLLLNAPNTALLLTEQLQQTL